MQLSQTLAKRICLHQEPIRNRAHMQCSVRIQHDQHPFEHRRTAHAYFVRADTKDTTLDSILYEISSYFPLLSPALTPCLNWSAAPMQSFNISHHHSLSASEHNENKSNIRTQIASPSLPELDLLHGNERRSFLFQFSAKYWSWHAELRACCMQSAQCFKFVRQNRSGCISTS